MKNIINPLVEIVNLVTNNPYVIAIGWVILSFTLSYVVFH